MQAPEAWISTLSPSPSPDAKPKRGEIWRADLGDGKKHAVAIVSLDQRNLSGRASSVLVVPFGSYGAEGPTVLRMSPGETGLPEPSFLKAHFIQVLPKGKLFDRLRRTLSATQLRELVLMVRRAIDPDAPYGPSTH
jgi:mRNA-degrading endonuclease toxin of MazEF toxin-antitoxin module